MKYIKTFEFLGIADYLLKLVEEVKTGKKIEVNSLSNEINRMFNKVIYNGLKKFDRLYSIFYILIIYYIFGLLNTYLFHLLY